MVTEHDLTEALKTVKYPGFSRDIVSLWVGEGNGRQKRAVSVVIHVDRPQNRGSIF